MTKLWKRFRDWMAEPTLGEAIVMNVMAREERERRLEEELTQLRTAVCKAADAWFNFRSKTPWHDIDAIELANALDPLENMTRYDPQREVLEPKRHDR